MKPSYYYGSVVLEDQLRYISLKSTTKVYKKIHLKPNSLFSIANFEILSREFDIPFPSSFHAETAYNSLRVDSEPKRGSTLKSILLEGNILKV